MKFSVEWINSFSSVQQLTAELLPTELKVNPHPVRSSRDFLIGFPGNGSTSHIITSVSVCVWLCCTLKWKVYFTTANARPVQWLFPTLSPKVNLLDFSAAGEALSSWFSTLVSLYLRKYQPKLNLIKIMSCVSIFIISAALPSGCLPGFSRSPGFLRVHYHTQFGHKI